MMRDSIEINDTFKRLCEVFEDKLKLAVEQFSKVEDLSKPESQTLLQNTMILASQVSNNIIAEAKAQEMINVKQEQNN